MTSGVKFFSSYWRAAAAAALGVSVRPSTRCGATAYRQRFARFLNNSGADRGTILLSLPLDGEGRTLDVGQRTRLVTVNYPETPAETRARRCSRSCTKS